MNLVGDIHAHRESRLTAMLEGTSGRGKNATLNATPSCYEVPFHDPGVRGNLMQDLHPYNRKVANSSTMSFGF
jgi:hypothetical protein